MKYAWIESHSRQWPVSLLCQVLGVSPSGYHARKARDVDTDRPRRRISNDALLVHIKAVHAQSKGEYGWPRVWKKLLAQGVRVGTPGNPTLMQQREKGMSPDGASGADANGKATGKIKQ